MLISNVFPSSYLKASDLQGKVFSLVIDRIEMVDLDEGQKPILYFHGKEKGMVLNRTNGASLVEVYGDETDNWHGKAVELFTARVSYQGRLVDGLRLRIPANGHDDIDSDIPW